MHVRLEKGINDCLIAELSRVSVCIAMVLSKCSIRVSGVGQSLRRTGHGIKVRFSETRDKRQEAATSAS
jgi:hypothetical protein